MMNRTLTFLRLDFLTLKPYFKALLTMIGIGIVYAFVFKNSSFLSSMFMVWLVIAMSYPFSVGEKCGIETLYATLNLRRSDVVSGRYGFALSLLICGVLLAILLQFAGNMLLDPQSDALHSTLATIGSCAGIYLVMVAFQYPFFFKMGYSKARMLVYIPFFLISVLIGMLPMLQSTQLDNFVAWIVALVESNFIAVCLLPVILGLAAVAISYICSRRIYERRDV